MTHIPVSLNQFLVGTNYIDLFHPEMIIKMG